MAVIPRHLENSSDGVVFAGGCFIAVVLSSFLVSTRTCDPNSKRREAVGHARGNQEMDGASDVE